MQANMFKFKTGTAINFLKTNFKPNSKVFIYVALYLIILIMGELAYSTTFQPSIIVQGQETSRFFQIFSDFFVDAATIGVLFMLIYLFFEHTDKRDPNFVTIAVLMALIETLYVFIVGFSYAQVALKEHARRLLVIPGNLFYYFLISSGIYLVYKHKPAIRLLFLSYLAMFGLSFLSKFLMGFGPLLLENILTQTISTLLFAVRGIAFVGIYMSMKSHISFKWPGLYLFGVIGIISTILSWVPRLLTYFQVLPDIKNLVVYALFGFFLDFFGQKTK